MEIVDINDPETILTQTQKKKIRKLVVSKWTTEEEFYDQIDDILESIHYPGNTKPYDNLKFETFPDKKRIVLEFSYKPKVLSQRELLLQKLRNKRKHVNDPNWQMYERLKSATPSATAKMLPNPDQVLANVQLYSQMLTTIPARHPVRQYLEMLIPAPN